MPRRRARRARRTPAPGRTSCRRRGPERAPRRKYPKCVAVVIASNLRKELAGNLLFDGVSFKVERRDRVALSGPNGAGKTTLLRMLAGQTEIHGGELVFEKGARVALHDQRPPLERELTLREYVLAGAADLVAAERELRRLEQAMAGGAHDSGTLNAYATRSEEHTSELQTPYELVCRLLL